VCGNHSLPHLSGPTQLRGVTGGSVFWGSITLQRNHRGGRLEDVNNTSVDICIEYFLVNLFGLEILNGAKELTRYGYFWEPR